MTLDERKELLKEARKRYPVGTTYIPAHLHDRKNVLCTVGSTNFFFENSSVSSSNEATVWESAGNLKKNGHSYCEIVYNNGMWAEITGRSLDSIVDSLDSIIAAYEQKLNQ